MNAVESPVAAGPAPALASHRPLALARWLFAVAALVVLMVAVGGITRLTESGLSITEWKPVTGALPPLSEAQWQAEFEAYKQIPQYTEVNGPAGMTLADYKFIFFWEWFHRLLGRAIGLAFALPLAWFWVRKAIPGGYHARLLGLLALGGLQGAVGWWMVTSGLTQDVKVSHLRLAAHLLLALTTLGALVWTALDLRATARGEAKAGFTPFGLLVLAMLLLQLVYGAFLAGLRAGYLAGSGWLNWDAWPLMQGRLVPDGIDWSRGIGHALVSDPYLVHFIHRWWAWALVAILVVLARRVRRAHRPASVAIHAAFGTQILLGIATVMSGMNLWLAGLHQLVGALLVAATVWGVHSLTPAGASANRAN
ncbi:cytochrome c oxidase assembly protein subunit 15 [Novosphingobium kunmingense]|uniref:Heme A synthase n=1 Tax=Novosphingobium kunmingense TaxID=1211806 RepID=A0A2N0H4W4_9SPHN|nr:COX15/CtaA family protein [Novosphingobium kunmingense]PKB13981.1 cytochrome c oxidase assembly protein subunit 15 [Novosphingobium kunmingense]